MMLDVQGVSKTYHGKTGPVHAMRSVSLSADAGDFLAVQGPSGCGKTTLLLVAGALLAPDAGRVVIAGQDPYALASDARARFRGTTIGFVFQQFHLIPYLSVLENVMAPAMATGSSQAKERALELVARFGIEDRAHHVPSQLSTGERQRTALARALLNRPQVILADEPTGNLDHDNSEAVLRSLNEFAEDGGTVLLVTHDAWAASFARQTIRLHQGALEVA